jgi:serpin B
MKGSRGSAQSLIGAGFVVVAIVGGCLAAPPAASPLPTAGAPSPTATSSPAAPTSAPSPSQVPAAELAISQVPRGPASLADAMAAGRAINAFGADLFRRVAKSNTNVVCSPASIVLALAMARAGARGPTATEMDRVMRNAASNDHPTWLNGLDAQLTDRTGTHRDYSQELQRVELRSANGAFSQSGMRLEQEFLDVLASRFGAGVRLVDYARDAEGARRLINTWVSDETEKRIEELLQQTDVGSNTRLVLVNAVYMKAAWLYPFNPESTREGAFRRLDGASVRVPLMREHRPHPSEIRAAQGPGWRAVELPYVGKQLAMLIVVPTDLRAFESRLAANLDSVTKALRERAVDVTVPRFGTETRANLGDLLVAMGMPTAFGEGETPADFSRITNQARLQISKVVHQANIDVDERGTEAAAATAVGFDVSRGDPPLVVRADRPFVFAIRDVPTGAILFLGHIVDPSKR